MYFNARFPVFVEEATVPRQRSPKPLFHFLDTVIEVAEITAADMPMAVKAYSIRGDGRQGQEVGIRYGGGRFYRDANLPVTEFQLMLDHMPLNNAGPYGRNLRTQADLAGELARSCLPKGIIAAIQRGGGDPIEYERFYSQYGSAIEILPSQLGRLETARAAFHATSEEFVVIDGQLWVECPEPMLTVDIHNCPGRMDIVLPPMDPESRSFREYNGGDTGRVTFTVAMEREARGLAKNSYNREMPWREKDFRLDVMLPDVFSAEVPHGDIIRHLQKCTKEIRLPDKLRDRIGLFLANPAGWSEDGLRDEVEHVLASVPETMRWMVRAIEFQHRRFDDEPISLHMPEVTRSFGI